MANNKFEGYVNYYPSQEVLDRLKELNPSPDMIDQWKEAVTLDGYTLKISHSDYTDSFTATLFGKDCIEANRGYAMTQHGGSPWKAEALVLYVHIVCCDSGSWMEFTGGQRSVPQFD